MKPLQQGWIAYLIALLAGCLVTLSLAPFDIWPAGIASVALLAWLLNSQSHSGAIKIGWFYGVGLFGSGSSWIYVSIHEYGYAPVPLATFLTLLWTISMALFVVIHTSIYCRWVRDLRYGKTLGFAALMVVMEWFRSWFLTGFPWLYLGYAHIDTPLAGWAPVAGVYAVSFCVALTGAVSCQLLLQRFSNTDEKHPLRLASGAAILVWLAGGLLQWADWVSPADRPPVSVAMVQTNISQDVKWNRDQYWPTLALYESSSKPLWEAHDIVIWPEAAIPGYYQNAVEFFERISAQASEHDTSLITGIPYLFPATATTERRYHNSIMGFGSGSGTYFKQRLVPFGEYVPLENVLRGLIQFFDMPMSAFSAGPSDQAPLRAGDLTLAPFICYEIVYPELITQWLPQADLLITISNDAWFGNSIGPLQHLQMAQMRALESGRYLLRATGTGVTAIIDQRGQIAVRGTQFKREVISGKARVFTGSTPYSRFGNWPLLIVCLLLLSPVIGIRLATITAKMRR